MRLFAKLMLFALLLFAKAQPDYNVRFEAAWQLVQERYWDLEGAGVDWQAVRRDYEPQALAADSDEVFYSVLEAMYRELGDDHSVYVPPGRVQAIRQEYGDLPCFPVFFSSSQLESIGSIGYSLLEAGIGYLRLPDLVTTGASGNLRAAVQHLKEQGAESLILDLRGNPGGRLIEMMQSAGVFTGGFLWRVVTRWTLPVPYPAIGVVETDLPLVVLIDGHVHSAAEGLAGALQDSGRATIIGETTAGNVEAVLPFCLSDGSQAWIATGVLAPLFGATWAGRGVEPDIAVPADEALEAAIRLLSSP